MKRAISGSIIRKPMLGLAIALAFSFAASAQSSKGNIMGTATTGDTIIVDGIDGGFHRELTASKDGKYYFRAVSPGAYQITVKRADGSVEPPKTVVVRVGSTARVQ